MCRLTSIVSLATTFSTDLIFILVAGSIFAKEQVSSILKYLFEKHLQGRHDLHPCLPLLHLLIWSWVRSQFGIWLFRKRF